MIVICFIVLFCVHLYIEIKNSELKIAFGFGTKKTKLNFHIVFFCFFLCT